MKKIHLGLISIIALILVVTVVPLGDEAINRLTCSPADSSMCAGWAVDRL